MRNSNILSFIRQDNYRPPINRTRHVNSQLGVSPDSPLEFRKKHTIVDRILHETIPDPHQQRKLEVKRIRSQGKGVNMPEYCIPNGPNLSLMQDFKLNESVEESESRALRNPIAEIKLIDTVSFKSKQYVTTGRIISFRNAFQENYSTLSNSKGGFKLQNGICEQFSNFKAGMRAYMNPSKLEVAKCNYNFRIPRRIGKKQHPILNSTMREIDFTTLDPITYQNRLNMKISKELMQNTLRTKRTISYN